MPTGWLYTYPMGDKINQCRKVIRAGGGHPVVGYEKYVGNRTNTIVTNN